jgi:hypothetical protein
MVILQALSKLQGKTVEGGLNNTFSGKIASVLNNFHWNFNFCYRNIETTVSILRSVCMGKLQIIS